MTRLPAWAPLFRWLMLAVALFVVVSTLVTSSASAGLTPAPVSASISGPTVNANDFPSIQAAVDSLRASGGSVRIPAGVHLLPAKLRIYSNIEVSGDGMDVTVLKFAPGVQDNMVSNSSLSQGNTNIVIRDLTLSGTRTPKSDCCYGLRLVNVSNVTVINVASDGHLRDGFYLGYYRQNGVYDTRLSGCRATNNGRNGISLTHGSGNIIDNCQVEQNNRIERVAGIDLEPDDGLAVTDNRVVSNTANGQNVGIQLFSFNRTRAVVTNNAVCFNTASRNQSAGIWENAGTADIFVNNITSGNGTNFSVDRSAKLGSAYASSCDLPPLPGQSPTATPTATPIGGSSPTPTPTATPNTHTLSTRQHVLTASALVKGKATVTSTIDVQDGAGQPVSGARVSVELSQPNGQKLTASATTRSAGRATIRFTVKQPGDYRARVTNLSLRGSSFTTSPADTAEAVTVR